LRVMTPTVRGVLAGDGTENGAATQNGVLEQQRLGSSSLKVEPVLPPSETEIRLRGNTAKLERITRKDASAVVYSFEPSSDTNVVGSCADVPVEENDEGLGTCDLVLGDVNLVESLTSTDKLLPARLAEYNQALHKLANASDSDGALALFNRLRASGVRPDVVTFNHLFRACKKGLRVEVNLLESIFRCMESQGLKPDATTFHELLSCYGRGGAYQHAERLFVRMHETAFSPDVRMYSSLITSYGRSRKPRKALKALTAMKEAGVKPDVTLFNSVMKAAALNNKWNMVVRLYEELQAYRDLKPDHVSYNAVIQAFGHLGMWKSALAAYQDMKIQLLRPTEITYNNLIISAGRGQQWQISAGLFGQMQRAGVKPSVVTYNSLITAYAHSDEHSRCLRVLRKMQDGGACEPNTVTFNALLTSYSQDSQASNRPDAYSDTVEVWKRLMQSSCTPNCLTYDAFVGACEAVGQPWHNVAASLEEMLDEWTASDGEERGREILCNLLLCVYERGRMCDKAYNLYAHMEDKAYAPALVTYNALLGICEFERKWERALQILDDMKASGCEPDGITYNALISTFEECGQWEQATDWLEVAQTRGLFKCTKTRGAELDLHHVRSAGTAQTILRWHLKTLRTTALVDRQRLPSELKLITGWGKHSTVTGQSPVKDRVVQLLAAIKSPFEMPEDNIGCLVASGELVHQWLVKDEIMSLIRFLSGNGREWRRNFAPKSQQGGL